MLTTGTVLQSRYRVVSLLGQGGMGAVYRVWDVRLNAPLALKEMVPQSGLDMELLAQLRQQFQQEANVLANLSHPSLVAVTDFFEELGNAYLVMKFVQGESLAVRIAREGALEESQVLVWAGQLLDALEYCHAQGVIHRDVKPQNVVIQPDGRAVLVDFGLVKLWNPNDPRTRTALRGMGTPEYAPPEQYSSQPGHTGPHSDLYGLGATLYHALTGKAPPPAADQTVEPALLKPPQVLNPRVSPGVAEVVLRAMALRPGDRFGSAAEMRAALEGEVRARRVEGAVSSQSQPVPVASSALQALPQQPPRQPMKGLPGAQPARPARHASGWLWVASGVVGVALLALCVLLAWGVLGGGLAAVPGMLLPSKTPVPTSTPGIPEAGDAWTRPVDGMTMVYVPAGKFQMGSREGGGDERPVHEVALGAFWIDRHEVTNEQYAKCMGVGACNLPADNSSRTRKVYYGKSAYANYPVIHVNWFQAAAYCAWVGGGLPTEAEWEYAARGPQGGVYPWGNLAPDCDRANYWGKDGGCLGDTALVMGRPAGASWVGAEDMGGNVWEWIADWYGPYPIGRQVNPAGPPAGKERVVRGGSWFNGPEHMRATSRSKMAPTDTRNGVGFRCALPAVGP